MSAYDPPPGYKQSRSTLRRLYGSRAIEYKGQSPLDSTPSGKIKYKMESGTPEEVAKREVENEFESEFRPRPPGFERPQDRPMSPWSGVAPVGENDLIRDRIQQDRAWGSAGRKYQTPYGEAEFSEISSQEKMDFIRNKLFGTPIPDTFKINLNQTAPTTIPTPLAFDLLEPSTLQASTLAQFAPALNAPQAYVPSWRKRQQQGGYMGSILGGPSKWLT